MIKSELITRLIEENPSLKGSDVEKIVEIFFAAIVSHLGEGGRVELRGFGAFSLRDYDARTGRNPRTGEAVAVAAKSRLHFKPGKTILERINAQA